MTYLESGKNPTDIIQQLQERIKELTCLYQIAEIANNVSFSMKEILSQICEVIPPAMQYPDIACCRLTVDDNCYYSSGYEQSSVTLQADIMVNYQVRGSVEIFYQMMPAYSIPLQFLPEEEKLLVTVAHQIAMIIEQKTNEAANVKLQEQLRHADRLATIGQLAAGIAHEINEPLGTILGFAQLVQTEHELPEAAAQDMGKIINATLHAREVVRKLMLFSRQMPPKKTLTNINQTIEEGFYFLENRCTKQGVTISRIFDPALPEIIVDPSQIHQVLVNLTVNAMQAMPDGGIVTIRTVNHGDQIEISVSDTGVGIDKDTMKKIFIPFFTTKDIDQGTGLGLAVVHGIVTAHNGKIKVESSPGKGSTFRIFLRI